MSTITNIEQSKAKMSAAGWALFCQQKKTDALDPFDPATCTDDEEVLLTRHDLLAFEYESDRKTNNTAKAAFVADATNLFGALKSEGQASLRAVLANPTNETWDKSYSLIVNGKSFMTLWQAWIAVDSNAPRSKPLDGVWPKIPDQMTIYRALKHATQGSNLRAGG